MTDLVILSFDPVTRTTTEMTPSSPNYHTTGRTLSLEKYRPSPHRGSSLARGLALEAFLPRVREHNHYDTETTIKVLKCLDKGEGVTKLATEFNVGKAIICDWRKNRRKLEQYCANSSGETLENRQTAKQSLYDKVDNALHIWFTQERQRGTPLSGPIIQEKAIQLNKLMNGDASFSASIGWLDRWKKRHEVDNYRRKAFI
ncbi:jerky protein homolog-like [Trichonephila clavipes]|uniref:Jerky protein homolog-like n=1 Tax=Trichonephila clavipes TaxID=2585209 RepID=A0A8X6VE10_TRICX|nr:jerky protein homolog-like [Trichonephila clavipes]